MLRSCRRSASLCRNSLRSLSSSLLPQENASALTRSLGPASEFRGATGPARGERLQRCRSRAVPSLRPFLPHGPDSSAEAIDLSRCFLDVADLVLRLGEQLCEKLRQDPHRFT